MSELSNDAYERVEDARTEDVKQSETRPITRSV